MANDDRGGAESRGGTKINHKFILGNQGKENYGWKRTYIIVYK